jgi:nucleoside-diphosphate-sugar epimerase
VERRVKLLVLGGTKFLGRAAVEAAVGRGHEVTLFNRGVTNPGLFPEAEHLHGDRTNDLSALEGRSWDAVIDPSGYVPVVVKASAELLANAVQQYLFVSSISVYADYREPRVEDDPLEQLGDQPVDRLLEDYANYGALKALCEQEVQNVFGERTLVVRPGLIVGPHDPTDRFTYWPRRAERGGSMLGPAPPEQPVQVVDVRDLTGWMVDLVEQGRGGVFNATSPPGALSIGSMLEACGAHDVVWVDEAFLLEHGVESWSDLPCWVPSTEADHAAFQLIDVSRAVEAGLSCRPLAETARDVPEWTGNAGLSAEREAELLLAWQKVAA